MHKQMGWGKIVFLCAVLVIAFLVGQNKVRTRVAELTREETALHMQLSDLREDAAEVERKIDMVGSKVQIMSEARDRYDYLRPGEMRFSFNNPKELEYYSDEEDAILQYELSID
ncbi:MAG: hypothetical protein IKK21_04260 [Clostridia bacterium]|nr:hypothetical protein [Clostridia bacterium]